MKILFVNSCLCDGGAERVMTSVANEVAALGHEVKMILIRGEKEDNYALSDDIALEKYTYASSGKVIKYFARIRRLRREMKAGHYDYIVAFPRGIAYVVLLAALGLKEKIIVSERNDPSERLKSFIKSRYEFMLYGKAYKIVFQTTQVMNMYPLKLRKKGVVIENPVHEGIPVRYEGPKENVVVAVGRLSKQKNFPMLIEAFSKFLETHPGYRLVIYGKGDEYDNITDTAKKFNVFDVLSLPGYVSDVEKKMRTAKMYVSSSNYEGISNTMLEAMALGMPVICTDCPVGGAAAMIEDSVNGFLVPINDADALCKAMCRVCDDEKLAETVGLEASKIREKYSPKAIALKWLALMK